MVELTIFTAENGFLVFDGSPEYSGRRIAKKWVARTPKDLGRLIEDLVTERVLEKTEGE